MSSTRREILTAGLGLGGAMLLRRPLNLLAYDSRDQRPTRNYHVCLSPEGLKANPTLLKVVADAGVTTVWLCDYFYGYWPYPLEDIRYWHEQIETAGMQANTINLPFGHPSGGDSLGSSTGNIPLTPPKHWKPRIGIDGQVAYGTSLHPPATEENAKALALQQERGVRKVLFDDDFRLAPMPGDVGGCFCDEHRAGFCKKYGYGDANWKDLRSTIHERRITAELRNWIDFTCDGLTAFFRAAQAAAPKIQISPSWAYMCDEKTGLRLSDYKGVPVRVGEGMFDDGSFGSVKSKTSELFSVLFHRRYVAPELAFSETTSYPFDKLSAKNLAAKFCISTIADVRNTLMMSGLTPFPIGHWQTLAPAMKEQAAVHQKITGHALRGPFKHYYGEAARLVGGPGWNELTYSLFLAVGIPFEVTDQPATEGYTFLVDADARAAAGGQLKSNGTTFIARTAAPNSTAIRAVPETLEALFALKHEVLPKLGNVPYVEQDKPVVCAWYPTARAVLLWSLADHAETFTVRMGSKTREAKAGPLGTALIEDLG